MEQWVPLFVAGVGAIAAIGVAFWNSRGESAELRQLKAMNEVLEGMSEADPEKAAFAAARNGLAVRVAERVTRTPFRRKLAWMIGAGVAGVAIFVTALALFLPGMTLEQVNILSNVFALMVALGGTLAGYLWFRRRQAISEDQLAREHARVQRMLERLLEQSK